MTCGKWCALRHEDKMMTTIMITRSLAVPKRPRGASYHWIFR